MTLIVGVNLSDRIYLAADCRVTTRKDEQLVGSYDCILKILHLSEEIIVAVAGSTKLASFLVNGLLKEPIIHKGINQLKEDIKDWVAREVDQYLSNHNDYTSVCLMFGGLDRSKQKQIDGKKILDLVKQLQDKQNLPMHVSDAIFKGLSAVPGKPNPYPILPIADSGLFAVVSNTRDILRIDTADWGDFLAYGPRGITKDEIPKDLFGRLEFAVGGEDPGSAQTLLTAFIKHASEKYELETVGGSVVIMFKHPSSNANYVAGKVHRLNLKTGEEEIISEIKAEGNQMYGRNQNGVYIPLIPFNEYSKNKGDYFI